MPSKTLLAGVAATLVGVAALTLAPAPASAGSYGVYAGNGYSGGYAYVGKGATMSLGWGYRPYAPVPPPLPPKKVCQPVYKTVTVWQPWYGWVQKTVYAGQECWIQPSYRGW